MKYNFDSYRDTDLTLDCALRMMIAEYFTRHTIHDVKKNMYDTLTFILGCCAYKDLSDLAKEIARSLMILDRFSYALDVKNLKVEIINVEKGRDTHWINFSGTYQGNILHFIYRFDNRQFVCLEERR